MTYLTRYAIMDLARRFVARVPHQIDDAAGLLAIGESLRVLALSPAWQRAPYAQARAGEELLYELAVSTTGGPSLYLVSDGTGVESPPHGHDTWAIIAGIRGRELNHRYDVTSALERTAVPADDVEVGPGQALVLGPTDVHATQVSGDGPTYHLHLYGRPLRELAPLASRRYVVTPDSR